MDYLVYILIVWFTWPFLEDPNWSGWATESIVLTSECDINRVIKYPFMQLNFSNDLHMHKLSIWSKLNNQILSFSSNMCLMQWKWKKYMSDLWGLQRKCYKLTSFASSLNTFFGSMVQCPTGVISIFHFQQNIHFSFKKKGKNVTNGRLYSWALVIRVVCEFGQSHYKMVVVIYVFRHPWTGLNEWFVNLNRFETITMAIRIHFY